MTITKGMIAAAAIASLGAGTWGMNTAYAEANPSANGKFDNLIEALAERFDVSEEEVLKVFQAERLEQQAIREEMQANRLANAVEEGYLTQEQADAITAYREEHQELMVSLINMDLDDRKEALDAAREEVKAWAKEQGIPLKYILPAQGQDHNAHHRMHNE